MMRSLRMECMLSSIVMLTVLWLPITEACLPDPTPVGSVHYATHVVVGTVWGIVRPDPRFPDINDKKFHTYGANVTIQCTYKNSNISKEILIGNAGFVEGMCRALPLSNGEYIMFLSEEQVVNGQAFYIQTSPAEFKSELDKYLDICGLKERYIEDYPVYNCPATKVPAGEECKRYSNRSSGLLGSSVIVLFLFSIRLTL